MADLGTFGTVREAVDADTFGYFGTTVRANPLMSDMDLADFVEVAAGIDVDSDISAAVAEVKKFLRSCIHPADFDGFWATARANGQQLVDLLAVVKAIVEAHTGRPTGRSSVSTDGPQPTPESSPTVREQVMPILQRHHPGRPDLQLAALRSIEDREAAAAAS